MSNVQGDPQCVSASSPLCLPPYTHHLDQSVILESQIQELNFKKSLCKCIWDKPGVEPTGPKLLTGVFAFPRHVKSNMQVTTRLALSAGLQDTVAQGIR